MRVLALLLLTAILMASWTEDLRLIVVDSENRATYGCTVFVKYQKNNFPVSEDTMDGYTEIVTDGSLGYTITFGDSAPDNYEVRYYIVGWMMDGKSDSEKVECDNLGDTCHYSQPYHKTIRLDAYRVYVEVVDQNGYPVEGVKVTYKNMTRTTDSSGKVWFTVLDREDYEIRVESEDFLRTVDGRIDGGDETHKVILPRYDLRFKVIDDDGNPLEAEVMVNGVKKSTENGEVTFEDIQGKVANVVVKYEGGIREFTYELTDDVDELLVVDQRAPIISGVSKTVEEEEGVVYVTAQIEDPGEYASGLRATEPAIVQFKSNGRWRRVVMYPISKDAFRASIPIEGPYIEFQIKVYDQQGNEGKYNEKFEVDVGSVPGKVSEEEEEEAPGESEGPSTFELIIGGFILFIIILIAYKKYTGEI